MIDRRRLLATTTAAALPLPALAQAPAAAPAAPRTGEAAKLYAFFDRTFAEVLQRSPETATSLGLDKGAGAPLKARLDDRSPAAFARSRADDRALPGQLKRAVDRSELTGGDAVNYDVAAFQFEVEAESAAFDYGSGGVPYVVTQLYGAYSSVPRFLDTSHSVAGKADADAYLARTAAFAKALDDQTARMKADAGKGVIPPDFMLDKALAQMAVLRKPAPAESLLATSLEGKAKGANLGEGWGGRAAQIVERDVYPALDRQMQAIRELRPRAVHDAGVKRLPNGEALYANTIKRFTTTTMPAAEIHKTGEDLARDLNGQMDAILKAQGLTQGSVADRVKALYVDPKQAYPNTDEGRARILAYCNELIAKLEPSLPRAFNLLPKSKVEVRRVPTFAEQGAAGGSYQRPPLDQSRPGIFYINLRDTAEWPRWTLPTLVYHEAAPGHHFQLALVTEGDLPPLRQTFGFSANTEGWALYAEQVCDELGLYQDDPLGRLGYLKAQAFRAARLVVDTGIHDLGWSREQAIAKLVELTGNDEGSAVREVERYCARPGQACSYMLGRLAWVKAREDAKARLGARFDLRRFHDVGLAAGPMPLTVLQQIYAAWDGGGVQA